MRIPMLLLAAAAACSGQALSAAPNSGALTAAVRAAVDRGELLYIYDQAAWLGTDDIRAQHPDLLAQAGGYVVTGDQRTTELVFYDKLKIRAVYRASFSNGKLTSSGPPAGDRTALTPLETKMISAKEKGYDAFVAADVGLCANDTPNLSALPPESAGGPVIVYLMTPQTDLNRFPLGGHFSVEVRGDGSVGKVRRFANSCIDMPMNAAPAGSKPVAFVVTHLLDPTPTEIHIFTSIASKTPLVVVTNPDRRMWTIDGNRVSMGGTVKKP